MRNIDAKYRITFQVKWHPSKVDFNNRFDKYLDPNFFQHRVGVVEFPSSICVFHLSFGTCREWQF